MSDRPTKSLITEPLARMDADWRSDRRLGSIFARGPLERVGLCASSTAVTSGDGARGHLADLDVTVCDIKIGPKLSGGANRAT